MALYRSTVIGDMVGHVWEPSSPIKGVVVIYHGYAAHGRYGTILFAAEMLGKNGYAVVSCDFHGFGKSPGTPGYIELETIVQDAVDLTTFAHETFPGLPVFAMGSSMGGNFALRVTFQLPYVRGAVLLGPMIQVQNPPPWWQLPVLRFLAATPGIRSIGLLRPSGLASDKQYRDPERRRICDDDPLGFHDPMCLATGKALLDAALDLEQRLDTISVPFLVIHGDADEIVPLEGSKLLIEKAASTDKTLSVYPDMLHSPLCEFPEVRDKVEAEILAWLDARR
ncbi:hypothetical protein CTAYLR_007442 [Chrysophaeum taylorii]|uniref:Serine aminopeptidase S33 domain-containing protein n=1 Tax=Chrysophaeum taylorii TaxID=2483200 RepID=A0AAD7XGL7_9STRA|nr:hypothetical protein CTAYLR_007442 [Chrysophaeum taylorii]